MRISKAEVYKSLDKAAANVKKAGGRDGRTSPAEMKRALSKLSGTERALTQKVYDLARGSAKTGASTTKLAAAVKRAKTEWVDAADGNKNGLSPGEIAKMNGGGKLAVALAKERAGGAVSGGEGGHVSGGEGGIHVSGGEGGHVSGGEGGHPLGGVHVGGGEGGYTSPYSTSIGGYGSGGWTSGGEH